jgi:hypothetical protein
MPTRRPDRARRVKALCNPSTEMQILQLCFDPRASEPSAGGDSRGSGDSAMPHEKVRRQGRAPMARYVQPVFLPSPMHSHGGKS